MKAHIKIITLPPQTRINISKVSILLSFSIGYTNIKINSIWMSHENPANVNYRKLVKIAPKIQEAYEHIEELKKLYC